MGALQSISTIVGSTKFPVLPSTILPPYNTFPPYLLISNKPSKYSLTAAFVCTGPINVFGSNGSPIGIDEYALIKLLTTLSYIDSCKINLLNDVHLYPAVPTAANTLPLRANSKLASSITIVALFPPNSKIVLPNLE